MIQETRIKYLNNKEQVEGRYVLYWMQAAQRAEYNHALEYAVREANKLKLPVVVVFGLTDGYPEANLRHYAFMLDGLADVKQALAKRDMQMLVVRKSPELAAVEMSQDAAVLVTDAGHTAIQRQWRRDAAKNANCKMVEVETNLIVPIREVSDKENYSAGTLRPRINKQLPEYMVKVKHVKPKQSSLKMKFDGVECFDISNVEEALAKLDVDGSVGIVKEYKGGTSEAKKRFALFVKHKLDGFADKRNDPSMDYCSGMSPYLHFGQISPLYLAMQVDEVVSPGKESFLEELIVRRELSFNFVYYNRDYDKYSCLPPWAVNTLRFHGSDKREYVYTLEQLEKAQTHDRYWNAAQKEMVLTGKMHGYMRMYWGKKILEWSKTPKQGFEMALYLNNKYELDGRDPNGYAGVAWCFGKHDRAWSEREVFGKVRYMNAGGLKRKFDIEGYVCKVEKLC